MKKGTHFTTVIAVLMGMVLLAPMLQARTCSGNGDVIGSYGFVGSRSGFFLLGATAPGTTTTGPLIPLPATAPATTGATTVTGSNTPIGALVAGLGNRNVFSAAGRVFADGMGNFYAAPAVGGLTMNTLVGTYKVTTDCGIVVTLSDPFTGGASTTTLTLEGEILDSATSNEIDLVGTGPNAAGGVLTLTNVPVQRVQQRLYLREFRCRGWGIVQLDRRPRDPDRYRYGYGYGYYGNWRIRHRRNYPAWYAVPVAGPLQR